MMSTMMLLRTALAARGRGCLDAAGVPAGGLPEEFVTVFAVPFGVVQGDVGLPEQILIGNGAFGYGDATLTEMALLTLLFLNRVRMEEQRDRARVRMPAVSETSRI